LAGIVTVAAPPVNVAAEEVKLPLARVTVPVGLVDPDPVTDTATDTEVFSTIDALAGETVTVGVVFAGVPPPPPLPAPVVFAMLPELDDPHPTAAKPMAATSMHAPSMFLHLRLRPGKKKINRASATDSPAAPNQRELPLSAPAVWAVEFTVTVAVPVVVVAFRETEPPVTEQVGRFVAPAGEEVRAQLRVTVPV
jgi:hypothetical protein